MPDSPDVTLHRTLRSAIRVVDPSLVVSSERQLNCRPARQRGHGTLHLGGELQKS
jgi:hypothetical protein